ncbi:hypothetical protein GIB67_010220, partial [Kingdonia uniflora]
MYEFKVGRCACGRSHDRTECSSKFPYSGTASLDFRKGNYNHGDYCEFVHSCPRSPLRYTFDSYFA